MKFFNRYLNAIPKRLFRQLAASTIAAVLCFFSPTTQAGAPSSILDTTFGIGGKVVTDFFAANDRANGIAIQSDGRIVVAGTVQDGNLLSNFALVRYQADGSLDTNFGVGGKVITNFPGVGAEAKAVALQTDGRIIVTGSVNNFTDNFFNMDFALARYNSDGSLDTTFGVSGLVVTDFAVGTDQANAIAIQPDGRIVVAGFSTQSDLNVDFALARYNTNGSLDASFDSDGKVTTDFLGLADQANAVALQADGRIVAAGFTTDNSINQDFALARYNLNGSLDNSFDSDGRLNTDFSGFADTLNAIAVQADGRIIAAGVAGSDGSNLRDFGLARYNSNGSLDISFGINGRVVTDFAGLPDSANAMKIQADGRIVVAGVGATDLSAGNDFALARYSTSGVLDNTFGVGGLLTSDFSSFLDAVYALAFQADGRIVAAGSTFSSKSSEDFALARYLSGYDLCVQDGENIFQLDSTTGDYLFTRCNTGFSIGGRGILTKRGCLINLQHTPNDRRVLASIDTCLNKGTASVQLFSLPVQKFSIADRNTADNTCACH